MKKSGFILFEHALSILLIMIIVGVGITAGSRMIENFRTYQTIAECELDHALELWSKSHKGVDESSVVFQNDKLVYKKQRLYPANLDELGEVQNIGYFSQNIDLTKFNYSTQDGGTRYRLEVDLPNGTVYTSKKSYGE